MLERRQGRRFHPERNGARGAVFIALRVATIRTCELWNGAQICSANLRLATHFGPILGPKWANAPQ